MKKNSTRIWIGRIFICVVLLINIECAIVFIFFPGQFTSQFELDGEVGQIVIRAMGLLFLMWNIPYIFAAIDPVKYRISLFEAIIMQGIGFFGEAIILNTISMTHQNLMISISRFTLFDGIGLALLVVSASLIFRIKK